MRDHGGKGTEVKTLRISPTHDSFQDAHIKHLCPTKFFQTEIMSRVGCVVRRRRPGVGKLVTDINRESDADTEEAEGGVRGEEGNEMIEDVICQSRRSRSLNRDR